MALLNFLSQFSAYYTALIILGTIFVYPFLMIFMIYRLGVVTRRFDDFIKTARNEGTQVVRSRSDSRRASR